MRHHRTASCASALLALCTVALLCCLAAATPPSPVCTSDGPFVTTNYGAILGSDSGVAYEYRGLPYAQPPVGERRWRPPVDPSPWAPSVLNATLNAPSCPQSYAKYEQSEDCLYLNVFVPRGRVPSNGRPVQVFLVGGAFVSNGASQEQFNGALAANRTGNIIVVPSYRLGVLGLMGHASFLDDSGTFGNFLLMDQWQVLKWVNRNIAAFGGDADRVTLYGQSAGSIAIGVHLTTQHTEGLFQQAIMESGAPTYLKTAADMEAVAADFQSRVGCPADASAEDTLACMRAVNVSTILKAQAANAYWKLPRPIVDGVFVTEQPLALLRMGVCQKNVRLIIGFQTNESSIFVGANAAYNDLVSTQAAFEARISSIFGAANLPVLSELYNSTPGATGELSLPTPFAAMSKADSDFGYACMARHYARLTIAAGNRNVWFYRFNRTPAFAPAALGSFHTGDNAYTFGHPCFAPTMNPAAPLVSFGPSCPLEQGTAPSWDPVTQAADLDLSRTVMDLWAAFTATGNPNARGVFASRSGGSMWAQYSRRSGYINAVIDASDASGRATLSSEQDVIAERCDFWDTQIPSFCGDGVCKDGETRSSCPLDCSPVSPWH
jgi:para-nitrobenzyl esterase